VNVERLIKFFGKACDRGGRDAERGAIPGFDFPKARSMPTFICAGVAPTAEPAIASGASPAFAPEEAYGRRGRALLAHRTTETKAVNLCAP
jgi:hypothetical protein